MLLFSFVFCIFIPFTVLSAAMSFYFANVFQKKDKQSFSNTLYATSKSIRVYLDDLNDLSLTPYFYSDIMDNMEAINNGDYFSDQWSQSEINQYYMQDWSEILNTSRNDISNVVFIPIHNPGDAAFVVQHNTGTLDVLRGSKWNSQTWFTEAEKQDGKLWYSATGQQASLIPNKANFISDDSSIFSVSRLIRDINTRQMIGVLRIDASDSSVKNIFENIQTTPNSLLLLLDQSHEVVYGTKPVSQSVLDQLKKDKKSIRVGGDVYSVIYQPVPDADWELIYLSSRKDTDSEKRPIFLITVAMGLLVVAGASIIFMLNSKHMVKSVRSITRFIRKVETGDLSDHLELGGDDEFTVIAGALNHMTDKLNLHINNEYKAVISQKNAEYIALQTQINPHFLYNTLSGFVTLNRLGKRRTLEQSILELSTLFRYTCSKKPLSNVKDEFGFVEQYLALQKLRFDVRLNYLVLYEPEAAAVTVPKLLLQPVVENAIIHGMEPCEDPILIQIYGFVAETAQNGKFLVIRITDNGLGFDLKSVNTGEKVGLQNIRERVELFNRDAFFSVASKPGDGTVCTFLFPLGAG